MKVGMVQRKTITQRKIKCTCEHDKGPDGLHLCVHSNGSTHDYCCAPPPQGLGGVAIDHCQCRIQKEQ